MFALRIIKMSEALPKTRAANVISNQILRSATSMAANYRAVGRARSKAEFVSKLGVVLEEADETVFWLEMLVDSEIVEKKKWSSCSARPTNWFLSSPHHEAPRKRDYDEVSTSLNQITRSPDHPITR
jgi:four helix bundle protein